MHCLHVFRIKPNNGERPYWFVVDGAGNGVAGRRSWSRVRTLDEWSKRHANGEAVDVDELPQTVHTLDDAMRVANKYDARASSGQANVTQVGTSVTTLPAQEGERPHISHSQLNMFCRCGEQYRRRYIEGERLPPGIALVRGSSFHKAAAHNFEQKKASRVDLSADELKEFAVDAFDIAVEKDGIALTDEERSAGVSMTLARARQSTAELVQLHREWQAPDYQPVLVEHSVRIPVNASHDLLGIVDLLDDKHRVVDFKTAGRKQSQADVDATTQLTVYAATVTYATGTAPSELRFDVVVDKSKPERQVLTTTRCKADVQALSQRIATVADAITRGVFPPSLPGQWWCSQRFCGYYRDCPYVNGGPKPS